MSIESTLISEFFEKRRQAILSLQKSKGIKASGLSASLLTVQNTDTRFQLIDKAGYFEDQEFGKKPGRTPFQAIYDWLQFKKYGLNYKDEKERRGIAWAIYFKHLRFGSFIYRKKIQTGVLSESLNNIFVDELIEGLQKRKVVEVQTDVRRLFDK